MKCNKCGLSEDLPRLKSGEYKCRDCLRPYLQRHQAAYYAKHKEHRREYMAAHWAAISPEQRERYRLARLARKNVRSSW